MTNIDRWPEAFENGIPKVGGRWRSWREVVVESVKDGTVLFTLGTTQDADSLRGLGKSDWTFLGFSDPPAQGAAAPQVAPEVKRCTVRNGGVACGKPAAWHWTAVYPCDPVDMCSEHHEDKAPEFSGEWTFTRIAPLVAPPPSLKAAVQQEGLTIPPQAGTRHEFWETFAQAEEGGQNYKSAKESRAKAQAVLAADLAYDAEADAIRENRIVRKAALQEMGRGDRECFKLRNLREFEAIKSAEHAMYFWWKS